VSSMEEVEAAEASMSSAKDALLNYVQRRAVLDPDHYRRLVAHLKRAETEFMRAISELGD
jgi:hypothetical protein